MNLKPAGQFGSVDEYVMFVLEEVLKEEEEEERALKNTRATNVQCPIRLLLSGGSFHQNIAGKAIIMIGYIMKQGAETRC